jgi:large subunit ribosomal protein L14e
MDLTLGQVVYSIAGRDKGNKFIVIDIVDESYVLISDGDLRRIENAKKKKIKHLKITGEVIQTLCDKLEKKVRVSNSEIRKALAEEVRA